MRKGEVITVMGRYISGRDDESNPGGRFFGRRFNLQPWFRRASITVIVFLLLAGFASGVYAATATNVGPVSAWPDSTTSLQVKMPYTGDDTTPNNTYTVKWKLCTDGTYPVPNTISGAHTASPYVASITGLTSGSCYNIQATYNDADGVTGVNPQILKIIAGGSDTTLLHNSNRFIGSTKWTGDGGWGLAGTKYGQITCFTCHEPRATNIKVIKSTITAPAGAFPGSAVSFLSTSGFGNDSDNHTTSTKVCEVCHSTTTHHRYDTSGQTDGKNHQNNTDCLACHPHSAGFYYATSACDSCHGNAPTTTAIGGPDGLASPATNALGSSTDPGAHAKHVTARSMTCDACHKGNTMPTVSNTIQMGFEVNATTYPGWGGTAVTTGTFTGADSLNAPYSWVASNTGTTVQTAANYDNTCSAVYCHGSTLTGGTKTNPSWVSPTDAACGTCHGGSAFASNSANPPTAGSHVRHSSSAAGNVGLACNKCHSTTTDMAHVDGAVKWGLDTADTRFGASAKYSGSASGTTGGLAPSSTYGSCESTYCHSTVQGASGAGAGTSASVQWGSGVTCSSCHVDMSTAASGTATGSHYKHANTATNSYACSVCHNGAGSNTAKHADETIDVVFSGTVPSVGSYNGSNSTPGNNAPGQGYGTCSTTYCHGTGTPTWGGAPLACNNCHGADNAGDLSAGHAIHYNTATLPTNLSPADDFASSYAFGCSSCHPTNQHAMGPANSNSDAAIGGTKLSSGQYTAGAANTDAKGFKYTNGSCSTNNCHSDGQGGAAKTAATWTAAKTGDCGVCHNKAGDASPTWSAPHTKHVNTYGGNANLSCNTCHSVTAASNTAINNTQAARTQHPNGTKNVDLGTFAGGSYVSGTGCSATYCHSEGTNTGAGPYTQLATQTWSGSTACDSCHTGGTATGPSYTSGSPKANSHNTHVVTNSYTCFECHSATVDASNAIISAANHVNKSYDVAGGKVTSYTYAVDGGTCSTACHGATTPKWGTTVACGDCHAVNNTLPPSHPTHYGIAANGDRTLDTKVNNTGAYVFECGSCHNNVPHVDGNKDVAISATWGGSMDGTKTCSNVYCHSDGNGGAGAVNPQWAVTTMTCGSCHAAEPTTGKHSVHAGSSPGDYNYRCAECHAVTVTDAPDASIAINDKYQHVDKTKDVDWGVKNSDGSPYDNVTGTCANIYCHSNGQVGSQPYTAVATPQWGYAGTFGCSECHNGGSGINSNAHDKHLSIQNGTVVGRNVQCGECHIVTSGANAGPVDPANHVNKLINIRFDNVNAPIVLDSDGPTYGGADTTGTGATKTPGSAIGSCQNVYCHSVGNLANATGTGTVVAVGTPATSFRTIAWNGGAIGCNGCHGDPADANKAHPGYTTGGGGTTTANSHVKHVESNSYSCDYCHNTTTTDTTIPPTTVVGFASGGVHLNRIENVSFKTNGGKTGTYDATVGTKTCSTTYCHGSGTPAWGANGTITCASCHDATSTGLSTRHDKHYNTTTAATALSGGTDAHTATGYVFACLNCHPTGQHATGPASGVEDAAVGGTKQLALNYTPALTSLTDAKGFKYTNYGTCSTICHTKDGATLGSAVAGNPTWNSTNALGCGYCHNKAGDSSPVWSAPHTKHINTYSVGGNTIITCNSCHSGTATDNATINGIAGRNQHPNGTKNVEFNATAGGSWSGTQCSNTYCHSNGTSFTAPSQAAMSWSASITTCNSCHGDMSRTDGMPNYSTGKANSHAAHVQNNNYTCNNCHNDTTTDGATITNYAKHVNKAYNLQAGGSGISFTPTIGDPTTPSSCATISCHGGNDATWGATLSCQNCHMGTGDTDDYTYGNGTTAKIDSTEWTSKGHGQTAIALDCNNCHDNSVGHNVSGNPFRLANIGTVLNGNCLACHGTGSAGYGGKNSSVKVNKYHAGANHDLTRNGGQYCWDCHDPHGDGANIRMVQSKPAKTSNTNGVPTSLPTNPVIFTNDTVGAGAGGFARTAAPFENGICNACHTAANTPHYNSTGVDGTHYTAVCTSCHNHSKDTTYDGNAFQGAGDCNTCHDYDVRGATYASGVWTGGTWGLNNQDAPVNEGWGAHAKHINHLKTRLAIGILLDPVSQTYGVGNPGLVCGTCHSNAGGDHGSGGRNINFNNSTTYQFGSLAPKYNGVSGTSSSVNPKSCSNISCHFTTTPVWSAY